jgi:hypothetical protein
MDPKSLLRWFLLAAVFGSVAFYLWKAPGDAGATVDQAPGASPVAATQDTPDPATRADVVVTYFTTDVRCKSCRTIEALSRQAIEEGFPEELARGEVVYRVVNTDLPENEHFIDDYQITNKTVIVSHQVDGEETEWTGRQDVWLLLDEPEEFLTYVREPVLRYLHHE